GMELQDALRAVTHSFERYYNVRRENVTYPFAAEAEFHSHDENYYLIRSLKLFESESKEYIFFAAEDELTAERLVSLDQIAWGEGLSRVKPREGHKSTDVALIVLAEHVEDAVWKQTPKLRHYKSYRFSLYGWSQYRLAVIEISSGRVATNRRGRDLRKLVSMIK
ncbi:MAG: hypothetical protein LUE86_11180, partial [Clostridiales bacterium]|nr:hypothetical protein [Clostridiales bacterium]